MITGKTESGFEFELEEDKLDDYELLELICKVDKGEVAYTTEMVDQLLGDEQKERLKAHLRDINGKVSAKAMMQEVTQIFVACKQGKNS